MRNEPNLTAQWAKLVLANNTDTSMTFKLKTPAPDKYVVRPAIGEVGANGRTSIRIIPKDANNVRGTHDFMVILSKADLEQADREKNADAQIDAQVQTELRAHGNIDTFATSVAHFFFTIVAGLVLGIVVNFVLHVASA